MRKRVITGIEYNNGGYFGQLVFYRQENKMSKITKKYYVGSSSVRAPGNTWAKTTLEAAIEDAKRLCEETGEEQIVVQIVRVVKPQKVPIVVEKV